jgi:iron uptake system component EfeO
MTKTIRRAGVYAAATTIAMAALVACGSDDKTAGPGGGGVADPSSSSSSGQPGVVAVTLSNDGCTAEPSTVAAGPLTFKVSNTDAAAVSELELLLDERIVGEKENLAPGFKSSFSLNLDGGSYRLYCPGAATEYTSFTVTGKSTSSTGSAAALLRKGTLDYGSYVESQVGLLVSAVKPLDAAIKAGDLSAARKAYAQARIYYERIEPVAESFTSGKVNLDARIDARAGDVPASQWTGFHVIEKGLFEADSMAGLKPMATGLVSNVGKLKSLVKGLTYQPAELLNGAGGLLDEVSKSKITGEEERYSHIDLVDFQSNVEGAEQAFASVKPGLDKVDPDLAREIATRFAAIDTLLDHYRDDKAIGGFVQYAKLTSADKRKMSAAVLAVKEPLSTAAAKVAAAS